MMVDGGERKEKYLAPEDWEDEVRDDINCSTKQSKQKHKNGKK